MKCLITALLVTVLVVASNAAPRQKRFAGFGAFSTVGGRVGCVVSENGPGNASLFINSHFTKYLSADEQDELDQYKQELTKFKADVKAFLEERQKQTVNARRPNNFPGQRGNLPAVPGNNAVETLPGTAADSDNIPNRTQQPPAGKQPEPPKKPSFCSEKATTQYVFDGCSVQGDNVYIGDHFVRKLSSAEQEELAQFDKQFTAYQKAVTTNFKQQVEEIFGKHFGNLFEAGSSSSKSGEGASAEPSTDGPTTAPGAVSAAPPSEPPKTPNFCTLIV
jgi:hypothetical protein